MKNKVVLITENFRLVKKIKSKIILLRENDFFETIEPENCFLDIKEKKPQIILYHLTKFNEDEFFAFLQKIKQTQELKSISVVLLYDSFDEDILCAAFELGITDFISTKATETEFTVRVIWAIQKFEKENETQTKTKLLSELKILEEKNFIYTENYTPTIIKEKMKNSWGTFIMFAPDINKRNKISPDTIVKIIKDSIRSTDIIGFGPDFKIYIWLNKTNKNESLNILKKIQKNLTEDFSISAGFLEIKNLPFEETEKLANEALSKALLKGNSFVYAEKDIFIKDKKEHKYKVENFENFLSPLFYQYHKRYEEKLFETKIKQTINKENGFFKLENEKGQASFVLKLTKENDIEIEFLFNIANMEIKAHKINLNFTKNQKEEIEKLLNTFIKDFRKYTNC